ncbi:MAG: tetratricopeptide repeat protein, partial [bacterium]|nr:tetratricopeptide repeat protein [bacterium]
LWAADSAKKAIPELEKELETVSGKDKNKILLKLSAKYLASSPAKAVEYGKRALKLSQEIKDTAAEAQALQRVGNGFYYQSENKKALDNYQQSLAISRRRGDKNAVADTLNNMGLVYGNMREYQKALEYHFQSLKIVEETEGDKKGIARSYTNISTVYLKSGDYDNALEYRQKLLRVNEEMGDKKETASALSYIGQVYWMLDDYDKVLEYNLKSLEIKEELGDKYGTARSLNNISIIHARINNIKKAIEYSERSLKILEEIGDKKHIASSLNNIGNLHTDQDMYEKSLQYHFRALKLREEANDREGISTSTTNIGKSYLGLEKYDKALVYMEKAVALDRELGDKASLATSLVNIGVLHSKIKKYDRASAYLKEALETAKEAKAKDTTKNIHLALSNLFAQKENYKEALEHYREYSDVKDSILNQTSNDKVAEMEARYESEKKKKEITLLQKNNEIQRLTLSRQKFKVNAFIAGLVLVFIIALLLFKRYLSLFAFWKKKSHIGHYRILEEIGSGGMGIVYKASPVMEKEKTVALKVIREEYSKDAVHRKRFMNEALLVDQLDHPHIVKVYERGETGNRLFIAMEMLQGESLDDIIAKGELIPLGHCIEIMAQLVDAVEKIHSKGIVHRDLKPGNIMLMEQVENKPFAKLLDFGLARAQSLTRLTETGEILGTINYLPPERISHQDFSAAGDIYSLGVVFYEMLTGEKPFLGSTPIDVIKLILEQEPIAPVKYRLEIPAALNGLVLEMMNKSPERRPVEKNLIDRLLSF